MRSCKRIHKLVIKYAVSRSALYLTTFFLSLLVGGETAFSANNPNYTQGMKFFSAGDYKNSDVSFAKSFKEDPNNSAALYMRGLSEQRLNNTSVAITIYRAVCEQFPDSAASVRAQSALAVMDPAYLKRWKAAHPAPFSMGLDMNGIVGDGVSPDFAYGTKPLTDREQAVYKDLLLSGHVLRARIDGVWTTVQLNTKLPHTYIGVNWIKAGGLSLKPGQKTMDSTVQIEHVRVSSFPFTITKTTALPVQLGQDFKELYLHNITMANRQSALAYHPQTLNVSGKPTAAEEDADSNLNPKDDVFEVPYKSETRNANYVRKIVSVQIDNSTFDMAIGESGITKMAPEQVRSIDPSYLPDVTQMKQELMPNYSVRDSSTVTFGTMRLGKIMRHRVPCRVETFTSLRYQAVIGEAYDYAMLGSEFYSPWTWKADERRRVLIFSKSKTKE